MMKKPSILWVVNQIEHLNEYVRVMESHGFHVSTAQGAEQALYLAQKNKFDIIITDLLMPPPDGIDFLREVHPFQKQAAIYIFSSYLYINRYRDAANNLPFPVNLIDKAGFSAESDEFENLILKPISMDIENKTGCSIWKRISDAVDIKLGWAGFSIDLKKLVNRNRDANKTNSADR